MILSIALLSILFHSINGASRYIISNHTVPALPIGYNIDVVAYPIDVCVNYRVELTKVLFGKFTCNAAKDMVTFTDYGEDFTCTTKSDNTNNTYSDTAIPEGDLYSFNCDGDNNYVVNDACTTDAKSSPPTDGMATCCSPKSCLQTIFATGVCVNTGKSYKMTECTATTSNTYNFTDPECNSTTKGVSTISSTVRDCKFYRNQAIYDVYRKMNKCIQDGAEISTNNYCLVYTTQYVSTTMKPVTTEEVDMAVFYYLRYVVILVMGIAIYIV